MNRSILLIPALVLSLHGQGLPARLQSAQRLAPDALRGLQAELATLPDSPQKAYFEAYTSYVLVSQLRDSQSAAMEALLDRTLRALESRQDADSLALAGACLGLKLGFQPGQTMTLAPRASARFGQALAAVPGQPRALFFHGLHVLHTPEFYGGGAVKALPILAAALQAAEAEPVASNPLSPAWGKLEARAWLAYALLLAGRPQEAREQCGKVLAQDPGYGFARMVQAKLEATAGTAIPAGAAGNAAKGGSGKDGDRQ